MNYLEQLHLLKLLQYWLDILVTSDHNTLNTEQDKTQANQPIHSKPGAVTL